MAAERAQHADLFHATPGAQVDLFATEAKLAPRRDPRWTSPTETTDDADVVDWLTLNERVQ